MNTVQTRIVKYWLYLMIRSLICLLTKILIQLSLNYLLEVENLTLFLFFTAQKVKFLIKEFFSKCGQICSFLRIWSHLLKNSLMENFIFCALFITQFYFDVAIGINLVLHKKYSTKPHSFLVIYTTLASVNLLLFRKNLLERIWKLIMTIDDKIRDEKLQYDINREAAKISAYHQVKSINITSWAKAECYNKLNFLILLYEKLWKNKQNQKKIKEENKLKP